MKTVADTLRVARSHLHDRVRRAANPRGSYRKPDDADLLPLIHRLVDRRPTYGYRRITALVNRELTSAGEPAVNHKRVFRIMRQNAMLLARHTGRRTGRHDGKGGGHALEPALVLRQLRGHLLERRHRPSRLHHRCA